MRRCAICGEDVGPTEPHVPTTDRGVVHVRCADADAAEAPRRCARCGHLLSAGEPTEVTERGQLAHRRCPAPPRIPRRQPDRLAHTSLPRRRRRP